MVHSNGHLENSLLGPSFGCQRPRGSRLLNENAYLRQLREAADDKVDHLTLLLCESDHRIKNSLQLVASLLTVQAGRESHAGARGALFAAATRVHAVARIHDALQKNPGEGKVDIGELVATLCVALHEMAGDPENISVSIAADAVYAPAELGRPIMLIVNELVINSLRHAFPENCKGVVRVSVTSDGRDLLIVVADNGQGLSAGSAVRRGYGTTLIELITRQIGGSLSSKNVTGARVELSVPLTGRAALDVIL